MLAALIDTKALLKVIWVSFAAGAGLTAVFSLAIVGAARFTDRRRDGRSGAAAGFAVLAAVALAGIAAAIAYGLKVMTTK
jgi:hypothetical protein